MENPPALPTGADQGPGIIIVASVLEAIATVCVLMRLWALKVTRRKLLLNDGFLLLGYLFSTALAVVIICAIRYGGLGRHAYEFMDRPWMLIDFGKLLLVAQALWGTAMTANRMSIVTLYIHIFSSSKRLIQVCYVMAVVCMLWFLGYSLTVFLNCRPLAFVWDKTILDGECGDLNQAYLGTQVSNLILDLIITLMPLPVVWGLCMPVWRRVSVGLMFCLGLIICAISIARISQYQLALGYDQSDFTYTGASLWIFTVVEPLMACSLACMLLLRPLVERFFATSMVSAVASHIRLRKTNANYAPDGSNDTENLRSVQTIGGGRVGWNKLGEGKSGHSNGNQSRESFEMAQHV